MFPGAVVYFVGLRLSQRTQLRLSETPNTQRIGESPLQEFTF